MKVLKQPALGRRAEIGDVYDVDEAIFLGNHQQFLLQLSPPSVAPVPPTLVQSRYFCVGTRLEKFNIFNIPPVLQLQILGHIWDFAGSSRYLNAGKKGERAIQVGVLCRVKNATGFAALVHRGCLESASSEHPEELALPNRYAVTEIDYGGSIVVTVEDRNGAGRDPTVVYQELTSLLEPLVELLRVEGQGVKVADPGIHHSEDLSWTVYSDFAELPVLCPTYRDVVNQVENMQCSLKYAIGVPLFYTMHSRLPCCSSRSIPSHPIVAYDDSAFFVEIFDDMALKKRRLDDFCDVLQKHAFCVLKKDLQLADDLQTRWHANCEEMQLALTDVLKHGHRGQHLIDALMELRQEFQARKYSLANFELELSQLHHVLEKIKVFDVFNKHDVKYCSTGDALELEILYNPSVDIYIFHYSTAAHSMHDNWSENVDAFMNMLSDSHLKAKGAMFLFSDRDNDKNSSTLVEARICHVRDRTVITKDILADRKANNKRVMESFQQHSEGGIAPQLPKSAQHGTTGITSKGSLKPSPVRQSKDVDNIYEIEKSQRTSNSSHSSQEVQKEDRQYVRSSRGVSKHLTKLEFQQREGRGRTDASTYLPQKPARQQKRDETRLYDAFKLHQSRVERSHQEKHYLPNEMRRSVEYSSPFPSADSPKSNDWPIVNKRRKTDDHHPGRVPETGQRRRYSEEVDGQLCKVIDALSIGSANNLVHKSISASRTGYENDSTTSERLERRPHNCSNRTKVPEEVEGHLCKLVDTSSVGSRKNLAHKNISPAKHEPMESGDIVYSTTADQPEKKHYRHNHETRASPKHEPMESEDIGYSATADQQEKKHHRHNHGTRESGSQTSVIQLKDAGTSSRSSHRTNSSGLPRSKVMKVRASESELPGIQDAACAEQIANGSLVSASEGPPKCSGDARSKLQNRNTSEDNRIVDPHSKKCYQNRQFEEIQHNSSKDVNILLLGESGVGKSTWINGVANYIAYGTVEEAVRSKPVYVINSSFLLTDDDYNDVLVSMGPDGDGKVKLGTSATQCSDSYNFSVGGRRVVLIDTPGIGDTRGADKDQENLRNIFRHLSRFQSVHGICILLKPNSSRMNAAFRFCLKELLAHLHKDACKNIVFVFTNSRGTFYRPGDTFPTLRSLLMESKDVSIPLESDRVYCMDNEPVRFLAATKHGVAFTARDKENYAQSWEVSKDETVRLITHIGNLEPHAVVQTLHINQAMSGSLAVAGPIGQVAKDIQCRILQEEKFLKSVQGSDGQMGITGIAAAPRKQLAKMLLCCNRYCENTKQPCMSNIYPHVDKNNCAVMDQKTGNCLACGCSGYCHICETYETETELEYESSKGPMSPIEKEISRTEAFQYEQKLILKAMARLHSFLKHNTISPRNDIFVEHLEHCIEEQQGLIAVGGSNREFSVLTKVLAIYRKEAVLLEDELQKKQAKICFEEIHQCFQKLYHLSITGKKLESSVGPAWNSCLKTDELREKCTKV